MFRECYFEYADISSQVYNLIFCYIGSASDSFDSGGKFDLKTDTIPRSHETLLYGKDYSAQPLEFEVEIINPESSIPIEKVAEIKNWLFGQDGWKKLTLRDERQNYYLKCIFEPVEDIVDGTGYRGFRCTLKNISPFWYGEEKSIVHNPPQNSIYFPAEVIVNGEGFSAFNAFIPIEESATEYVDVRCEIILRNKECPFILTRIDVNSKGEALDYSGTDFTTQSESMLSFILPANYPYTVIADSKYATIMYTRNAENVHESGYLKPYIAGESLSPERSYAPFIKLKKGNNFLRFYTGNYIYQIKITYTPTYRLGAF